MNRRYGLIVLGCMLLAGGCSPDIRAVAKRCRALDRQPVISPDYAGVTIPPNIAPMNFRLCDSSTTSIAELVSESGRPVLVHGVKGAFRINAGAWRRLLSENAGKMLRITVYAKNGRDGWIRYRPVENVIAGEPADRYCTYRLLSFQYNYWRDLRECQRDITTFDERVLFNTLNDASGIWQTDTFNEGFRCVNCHTPLGGDPGRFVLQLRSKAHGAETLIAHGDSIDVLSSRLGLAAWYPDGHLIAFSVYKVQQYFHSVGRQFIDVYDNNSGIVIYDVKSKKTLPVPQLDRDGILETTPAWSPDGRYLYYCAAPVLWSDYTREPPENFNRTRYSLMRIACDAGTNSWGEPDTVLSTNETGLSIALPRLSPDGKFCLFCMQNASSYPFAQSSSDLYLLDLQTNRYRKCSINSEYSESWHSWSTNGRWILFASRRGSGIFTRLYLCHIDQDGKTAKPFVLPQRDPDFYESFTKCYNVAEFAHAPVRFSERQLRRVLNGGKATAVPLPDGSSMKSATGDPGAWKAVGSRE